MTHPFKATGRLAPLAGRGTALITGGGAGLGLMMARRLGALGARLVLLDVEAQRLAAAAADLAAADIAVKTIVADTRDEVGMQAAITEAEVWGGGRLDLVIANAGVAVGGSMGSTPIDDWRHVLDINLIGTAVTARAALPALTRSRGHLHIVASAAGFMSSPMMAAYNASKAGVVALAETLRGELAGIGVAVSLSLPAFFRTRLLETLRAPAEEREAARLLTDHSGYTVERAADDILGGIDGGDFYIFAPSRLKTLWRWKRFFPDHYLTRFPALRLKRLARLKAGEGA